LGCRDVARVDFRVDTQNRVYFLECNPLPGLAPGWSDLVLIAKAAGIEYKELIAEILSGAIRRYKERERERRETERGAAAATPPNGSSPPTPEEQKQEPLRA
ncbi:MAG: D-alanine--D-alanine ligase, partial [Myxococcales bacterium]